MAIVISWIEHDHVVVAATPGLVHNRRRQSDHHRGGGLAKWLALSRIKTRHSKRPKQNYASWLKDAKLGNSRF